MKRTFFLARRIRLVRYASDENVEESGLFSSRDAAVSFLEGLVAPFERGDPACIREYRNVVEEFDPDRPGVKRSWKFALDGRELVPMSGDAEADAAVLFEVGNLVLIRPNIQSDESPLVDPTWGVVLDKKLSESTWLYEVGFVSEYDLLSHLHLSARSLERAEPTDIPDELVFLRAIADAVSAGGVANLPSELVETLRAEVRVRNVPRFDFLLRKIVPPYRGT